MTIEDQTKAVLVGLAAIGLTGCAPQETVPDEAATRPTKEALIAQFDSALEIAAQTEGSGKPALWTLADEDTTIHLFGTVHLLRPGVDWRSQAFEDALGAADTIVLEVDMKSEEAQRAITTDFNQRGMFQDGQTLRSILEPGDEAMIEGALSTVGVPMDAFNAFEPWMVAISLSSMKLLAEGYDLNSGVESVIEEVGQRSGKSFDYLEEISDQADAFDLLPLETQIGYLYETALLLEESPRMLDHLVAEWADGDVVGLGALVASPDSLGGGEQVYQSLLVNRNKKWLPKIEAMLDEPGTVFVAVGSGHLAGPDSVIEALREQGYTVTGP
ncbi:MAG: TraB/GumN family protein [Pseudomonadota bacterium]